MKVIITGVSGFVGQNLSGYLSRLGFLVEGLSLRDPNWRDMFPKQATAIIHLAGKAHDTSNLSNSEDYFKVNRDLTVQIYDEFLKSAIKDFFYFSSVKAVADTLVDPLKENVIANPQTPYGKSKSEAEEYLLSKGLPDGKRLFIIRPCMIHGPGNKGNLNLLYKIVEKGIPWPLASFDNYRSFMSIDNLSYLIAAMLENDMIKSGVYNFADDEALSTNDLVCLMAKCLDKTPSMWYIPKGIIETVGRLGNVLPLPLNSERLKKLTESYIVSNLKIKKALHIEKLPLTAVEGLVNTVNSFNKQR